MSKDIREFYEEYKKGMEKFKKQEEIIKKEKDDLKRTQKLDKLLIKKLKFQQKFAELFLKGMEERNKNE